MPAVLNMIAIPGHLEKTSGYTSKVLEICGQNFGRESKTVGTIADVREGVAAFGARVRADYPAVSFYISMSVRKGDRKPRGFDDASRNGGLGQDDFLILREPEAA